MKIEIEAVDADDIRRAARCVAVMTDESLPLLYRLRVVGSNVVGNWSEDPSHDAVMDMARAWDNSATSSIMDIPKVA